MQPIRPLVLAAAFSVIVFALSAALPVRAAKKFQVLHTFHGAEDGQYPPAGVIFDAAGNLYGTTRDGGRSGSGTVFKLTPGTNHKWTETLLHSFNIADGSFPYAGLTFDGAGNLYGTTTGLGNTSGNVFQLVPQANGKWSEVVLHAFNGTDGELPWSGVTFDVAGNLYGTTGFGGYLKGKCSDGGCGTVFKLAEGATGKWSLTTLHAFDMRDGAEPTTSLIFDATGNLYGTALFSGEGGGNVFELTHGANDKWAERVLHTFRSIKGGAYPNAVIFDASGNLYGTTYFSGSYAECNYGCGVVFELIPGSNGDWTERILHTFHVKDGSLPDGGLIFDGSGNLYGTTSYGGSYGYGTVFKLTPRGNGKWAHTILHNFNGKDGAQPSGALVFDAAGSLYGTTPLGGKFISCSNSGGCGVVFKITP
jgi:uncharacterized repeat protein (TIGR03803 family)